MSSDRIHRPAVTVLALAILLALAAPPAQAAGSFLDTLGAKVQTWVAAWWPLPAAGAHGIVTANPEGGARSNASAVHGGGTGGHGGGSLPGKVRAPGVRPLCTPGVDPNGCPH
jgi:hypothetical protein